jgi:cobyrinic acid a,c-diamide synthase
MIPRVLVIGGTASGVGKTTVTLGLLEACRRRGLAVQAFKVGPDFIDPGLHEVVTGRPSYNLDGWMCGPDGVRATFARHAADADLAIVEGVMGCFDGADALGEAGSTAELAKRLGAPVVLVVDVSGQSRSVAATVLGFERFDPGLAVVGVIANRVGGSTHARWTGEAVRASCRAAFLGAIPHDAELALPERHLGLVTAAEGPLTAPFRAHLAETVERHVDVDRLLALASPLPDLRPPPDAPAHAGEKRARVAVARDVAFQFYYRENLAMLEAAGVELVFWSPLTDALPDADGLYFGGGYPELHARRLADNAGAREAVRELARRGAPLYAECGGLMYLAEALEDLDGVAHPMAGVLPSTVRMRPRRLTLGYREVRFTADNPLGAAGTVARGHEFHASHIDPVPPRVRRVWRVEGGQSGAPEGYLVDRALISYVHLHFGSNRELPRAFVAACADARR